MGVLSDIFAATKDELDGVSIDWGPVPPTDVPPRPAARAPSSGGGLFGFLRRKPAAPEPEPEPDPEPVVAPAADATPALPVVQSKGILTTQLGALDTILTGDSFEAILEAHAADELVRDAGDEGPWIFSLRAELRDALAALPATDVDRVGRAWAADEEIGATDREGIEVIVGLTGDLRDLAITARDTGRDLYLWASL